jgi:hypothetical protein
MEALEQWQQQALSVGYFDEGYQASQLWKADWEAANGNVVAARARAVVEMVEPLRGPTASGQSAADGGPQAAENPTDSPR